MHRSVNGYKSPRHVSPNLKPGQAPALRGDGVHRPVVDAAATRVHHVIRATRDAALRPFVVDIDVQRRVYADRRMHARRRLPRTEADPRHELAVLCCRLEWDSAPI